MKQLVSVAGGEGPYTNIRTCLSRLDLSGLKGKKVLVKPNCGRLAHKGSGIITHSQAIAAVIDAVRNAGASFVAVGESPILGVNTVKAFEVSGIFAVAKEKDVPLIDLDKRPPVIKQLPHGILLHNLKICADIYDFDYLISVPVAKMHMHTLVTLGIKNIKGCLRGREKVRLHQLQYQRGKEYYEKTLDIAISDLASVLLPDIVVIDAFIGLEGMGPSAGDPIKSDFAVASFNALAADMVCCELMGLDPFEVPHLRLIRDRKIYPYFNFDNIDKIPNTYKDYTHPYKRPPKTFCIDFPNIVVHDRESCSACLSTLLLFLKSFSDQLESLTLKDGKIHCAIGKNHEDLPQGTILIGNCTAKYKERGIFISGCPPVSSRILKILKKS
ncbi:MAG: DUF362 domain-containing protein [bacterium]